MPNEDPFSLSCSVSWVADLCGLPPLSSGLWLGLTSGRLEGKKRSEGTVFISPITLLLCSARQYQVTSEVSYYIPELTVLGPRICCVAFHTQLSYLPCFVNCSLPMLFQDKVWSWCSTVSSPRSGIVYYAFPTSHPQLCKQLSQITYFEGALSCYNNDEI